MVLHLTILLILSSLIHLVDFLDPLLLLSKPKFNLKTYGGRSFTIAAPSVWNALPFELRSCNSLSSLSLNLSFRLGFLKFLMKLPFRMLMVYWLIIVSSFFYSIL